MAEIANGAMAQPEVKGCTGDCKLCSLLQRGYCASQIAYNNMGLISEVLSVLDETRKCVKSLSDRIDAIQASETELIDPIGGDDDETPTVGTPLV